MDIPRNLTTFLWKFIKLNKLIFFVLMLTAIMWAINQALFPYFIKWIVNILNSTPSSSASILERLKTPFICLLGVWFLMEIAMRFQGFLSINIFPRFRAWIRETVIRYVRLHSLTFFANHFTGNIANKLDELPNSCQAIIEIIIFNFASIFPTILIALILMGLTNIWFAGILLFWLTCHVGVILLFLKKINEKWEAHSESVSILTGKLVDSLTNISNIRLFAHESYETEYFNRFQSDEMTKSKQVTALLEWMKLCHGILAMFLIYSMMFTLIYGWKKGWVTLGDFSLISMLSFSALGLVWAASYLFTLFSREVGKAKNALTLITKSHDVIDSPYAKPLNVKYGHIEFCNVVFSYEKNQPLFDGLNILISSGQTVGLVGISGSGKSTFVNLILRLYDIDSGEILIDDQNIAKITQESLRKNIAVIPQDPKLFHRTILENIRYGRLNSTDEEVIEAAKFAHCHEFISILPEGYASEVGEHGVKLSGGQRQRIAIARAILKNAPIIILDEATSALDSVTENYIQESLSNLMKGRTTIVIAHRLSTLANIDRILVFQKGNIVEEGTQKELLCHQGHFAKLWAMQNEGYLA
jgi:ATP-binding cassette subfamily B protein